MHQRQPWCSPGVPFTTCRIFNYFYSLLISYTILAKGLLSLNAWDDALAVLKAAIKAFPEHCEFEVLRRQCMEKYWLLENKMRIQGRDGETVNRMLNSGQLERVAYPWIASKELERSAKAMKKLNAQFEAASENACIQRSPLKGAPSHHGWREAPRP